MEGEEQLETKETKEGYESVTPVSEEIAEVEASDSGEDDSLPFPTARIVKIIRDELHSGKQIRGEVKESVNLWLGNLLRKVAREMNNTQFGSIGMADFLRATKPYDMIEDIVKDRERLILSMDKIKSDADQTKRDMTRFFKNLTGKDIEEPQI